MGYWAKGDVEKRASRVEDQWDSNADVPATGGDGEEKLTGSHSWGQSATLAMRRKEGNEGR